MQALSGLEWGSQAEAVDASLPDGLWERAQMLRGEDRILVELSLRAGASHRQIAAMLNLAPGSVSRRLAGLGRRLHDPVVLALLHPDCPLDPHYRQVGVEHFLVGFSAAELAAKHEMTLGRVHRVLELVKIWHRGVAARRNGHAR